MGLTENMVVADRYRLVRMIGRGGMGSVWQAQHMGLDTPCAIKFIEGELANVAEAHARFEREAKAAAQLRSPHVVQIFDHGVWQGTPYIAMELLDGEDLGKRLAARGGRLPPSEVNTIMQQVCRALTKAHAAGIVHRDLKPDNIFLVRDDDREIVKILDFGVAKSTSQALDGSNTKTGAMLGTPYYMSPEQAQGIKSVDSRSDLWSLAVIVFQAITGRLPFESEALGDLLVKIIVNPIPTPSDYYPNVPAGFDRWWGRAADRNPDGRFATAKEFSESLQLALGQSSVTDVNDRARLQKLAGATALMNTPAPNMNPAQTAAMNTPNPAYQSGPHAPMMMTPPGAMPNPMGIAPGMGTPNPAQGPIAATFSGVDQNVEPQKKSPPLAVILAAFAGLALVGLVVGGVAVVRSKSSAGTATAAPPASVASVTPTSTAVETPTAKTPEPPVVTAEPTASASASATAEPANTVASAKHDTPPSTTSKTSGAAPTGVVAKPPPGPGTGTHGGTKTSTTKPTKTDLGF